MSAWTPGWRARRGRALVAEGGRAGGEVDPAGRRRQALGVAGEGVVGRVDPALDERGVEAVGPFQGGPNNGPSRRDPAGGGRRRRGGPAHRPATGASPVDPAEEVPDVDGLLDHPVAGAGPLGEPAVMPADRPVAADPRRPPLDEGAEVPRRISPTPSRYRGFDRLWNPTCTGSSGALRGLGDHRVALDQGRRQRLLGIQPPCPRGSPRNTPWRGGRKAGRRAPRRRPPAPARARAGRTPRAGPPAPSRRSPGRAGDASPRRRRRRRP